MEVAEVVPSHQVISEQRSAGMVNARLEGLESDQEATQAWGRRLMDRLGVIDTRIRETQEQIDKTWEGLQLQLQPTSMGLDVEAVKNDALGDRNRGRADMPAWAEFADALTERFGKAEKNPNETDAVLNIGVNEADEIEQVDASVGVMGELSDDVTINADETNGMTNADSTEGADRKEIGDVEAEIDVEADDVEEANVLEDKKMDDLVEESQVTEDVDRKEETYATEDINMVENDLVMQREELKEVDVLYLEEEVEDLFVEGRPNDDCGITPHIFEYPFTRIRLYKGSRKEENLLKWCKCSFREIYHEQFKDHNLKKTPKLVELVDGSKDAEEHMGLTLEKALLKLKKFHSRRADYEKNVSRFSSDLKDEEAYAYLLNVLAPEHCTPATLEMGNYYFQEQLSRHQTLIKLFDKAHTVVKDTFIAPSTHVIGGGQVRRGSSIWYGCVQRSDVNSINVRFGTNIQDNSLVHIAKSNLNGKVLPDIIGDNVIVGHIIVLHGCTVEDESFMGMGVTLLEGIVVERHGMVAAGALVRQNTMIPTGVVWCDKHAKFWRKLTDDGLQLYRTFFEQGEGEHLLVQVSSKCSQLLRFHINKANRKPGTNEVDATWELFDDLMQKISVYTLEDKCGAEGRDDGKRPLADVWVLDTAAKLYEWRKWEPGGEGHPPHIAYDLTKHRDEQWEWAIAPGVSPSHGYHHAAIFVDAGLHVSGGALGGGRMMEGSSSVAVLDTAAGVRGDTKFVVTSPRTDSYSADAAGGDAAVELTRHCRHVVAAVGDPIFIYDRLHGGVLLDDLPCGCVRPFIQVQCRKWTASDGIICPYLHRDKPKGCDSYPCCIVLPYRIKLQQISNHLELIKLNLRDEPDKQRKDVEFAFAIFADDIDMVGGSIQNESFMDLSEVKNYGKRRALEKLILSWTSGGDKVLISSYSVRMLDILEKFQFRKRYEANEILLNSLSFKRTNPRNVISWGIMISGLTRNGEPDETLEMLGQMIWELQDLPEVLMHSPQLDWKENMKLVAILHKKMIKRGRRSATKAVHLRTSVI